MGWTRPPSRPLAVTWPAGVATNSNDDDTRDTGDNTGDGDGDQEVSDGAEGDQLQPGAGAGRSLPARAPLRLGLLGRASVLLARGRRGSAG